jgi:hypothetical protein
LERKRLSRASAGSLKRERKPREKRRKKKRK